MFKPLYSISQKDRCTSTNFNYNKEYDYMAFSEGIYLKIYNASDISNFNSSEGVNSKNSIRARDTIIQTRFSNDGKKLVISDFSNCIQVFNVDNQFAEISKIETGALKTWKFTISPNNNLIATGCNSIMLFDIDSGEKITEISNDNKYVYTMTYLSENTLALGNTNGSIYIVNTETKKRVNNLKDSCMTIRSILHDDVNNRLLSASDDLHLNIYNTKDFKIMFPLVGHKNEISNIQFNPINNVYATSSFDGTIKIWDAKLNSKNNLIQTLNLNNVSSNDFNNVLGGQIKDEFNIVWDISFSYDGKYLMAGSENGLHIFSC